MATTAKRVLLSYQEITLKAADNITEFMEESHRHTQAEATTRREWAYGVYMGWRALVAEIADESTYFYDDRRLEALLNVPRQPGWIT